MNGDDDPLPELLPSVNNKMDNEVADDKEGNIEEQCPEKMDSDFETTIDVSTPKKYSTM